MKLSLVILLLVGLNAPLLAQSVDSQPQTNVAILLYPGVELLDFAGPLEVFSHMKNSRVYTVAAQSGPLSTMKKSLTLTPDYLLTNCPPPAILVVPGAGSDPIRAVVSDTAVIHWIQRTSVQRELTMSVCTGAYILAKAGLLDNKTVTTHWASTQMLQQMTPKARVMEHTRFVDDGKLITTAGVSAGIDGALRVVSRLRGSQEARSVAEIMEYEYWNPESGLIVGRQPSAHTKPSKMALKHKPIAATPVARPVKPTAKTLPLAVEGIDPVCHMRVAQGTELTVRFGGKQYGFCSGICKSRFEREPTKYVAK